VIRLVRGELRKLFTTKLWLWLLLTAFAVTAIFLGTTIAFDGTEGNPQPPLSTPEGQRNLFSVASSSGIFALILGIIAVTGEFRHQTVTPTFLATPHRGQVVLAKLLTYAVVGIGYGVAVLAFAVAMALPWLAAKDVPISLTGNGVPGSMVGTVAGVAVYAVLGVGVGALVRNQIAAVVGSLVYLFVVEAFASALPTIRDYYRYLPGGANAAVTGSSQPGTTLLEPWQGGLVLIAYGVVFAVAGARLAVRRDVS
jgi:ABC-type transport system involved in multi-copper enzyme maturation permease subunit